MAGALWNSMIVPFLKTPIYGAVWYQGESDCQGVFPGATHSESTNYACTFPSMISSWRKNWFRSSGGQTDPTFPFGFVQLSTWDNGMNSTCGDRPACNPHPKSHDDCPQNSCDVAVVRWGQTGNVGYVPNSKMIKTFMSVAVDQGDGELKSKNPWSDIHTRNKRVIGERLALAGQAVAYPTITKTPWEATTGPLPLSAAAVAPLSTPLRLQNSSDVRNHRMAAENSGSAAAGGGGGQAAAGDAAVVAVMFKTFGGLMSLELRTAVGFELSPHPCNLSFPNGPMTGEGWQPAAILAPAGAFNIGSNVDISGNTVHVSSAAGMPGAKCIRYNWYNGVCAAKTGTGLCAIYGAYNGGEALPAPPFILDVV